ncbi:MAG: tetraacyldisaccharide 4'-kinase [Spirochaetaceae bacterium]|nr:tetraacyldisaccharide 4'-kinase [Spirochaetaceae bacterium]|tara:strand:+ start:27115 stop:28128 length:1014 start_codon:yes stop_codon:yes gene_type:complete
MKGSENDLPEPIRYRHWLQKLYLKLHYRKFERRLAGQKRISGRVVSIGNLSAGGTGKTPLGIWLLEAALKHGYRPAVVLRGYGGKAASSGGLAFDGESFCMDATWSGDEAQLYHVPGARVIVGADRFAAIQRFGQECDFFVLDDAFQNPSLFRDLDIVLIDATQALGSALIPLGKFREPLGALQRASAVVLTRTDLAGERARQWRDAIGNAFPHIPIWDSVHEPGAVRPALNACPVVAASGIGNPAGFESTLASAGFSIIQHFVYRDHYRYSISDLRKWQKGYPVITTEKDLVRIRSLATVHGMEEKRPDRIHLHGIYTLPVRISMDFRELERLVFA